ncbi:tyrosine-type recombinase/integrase [Rhodococcus maanshanensis]|uniref:Site-specific recombinase XerD n=1 Tax=Rhodococcus maanshanensis TaxID=183556 RepID=A0A1H7NN17_9NOCA|nr:site-specific integrase [Rhodococcus maanshanensis]SEL24960.1 Site-specific recombinase XerD [Rhodococcus maanshanensis]
MASNRPKRGFGAPRKLKSGRWQARYTGPDGLAHKAATTFGAYDDAVAWLAGERRRIDLDTWTPPATRDLDAGVLGNQPPALTLAVYAERWFAETEGRHKPRTRALNRGYLDNVILPELGAVSVTALTVQQVRAWFAGLESFPTRNSNAYSLLRTILNQALDDELIAANPCRVKRAAVKRRVVEPIALTASEIRAMADAMPERWRALILVAGFSGLRWGELVALRRSDFVLKADDCSVTVSRAVVRMKGEFVIGAPKSRAALRTVPLPSALRLIIAAHIEEFALPGRAGLVFPSVSGQVVHDNSVRPAFKREAKKIGHPALRFHDLRHSAATLFAQAGATLADHMMLMGHTSSAMSARYTHSTAARNRALVEGLWE